MSPDYLTSAPIVRMPVRPTIAPEVLEKFRREAPGIRMLFALRRKADAQGTAIYAGTVSAKTVAHRRAANRAARVARRANR